MVHSHFGESLHSVATCTWPVCYGIASLKALCHDISGDCYYC